MAFAYDTEEALDSLSTPAHARGPAGGSVAASGAWASTSLRHRGPCFLGGEKALSIHKSPFGKGTEVVMTTLLEKAFEKASQLPDVEQNALAKQLLEELESEKRWGAAFAESEDILDKFADEALEEHRQGKTRTLNVDEL